MVTMIMIMMMVILMTHIKIPTLQRSCQRECTEDIMAASIQPPVTFKKIIRKITGQYNWHR